MRSLMIFFNVLMNHLRVRVSRLVWNINFQEIGEGVELDLRGSIKIGSNLRLGQNVSIIVEKGSSLILGDNVFIGSGSYIKCYGGKLIIGDNVSVNAHAFINACGGVVIKSDTRIGAKFVCIASNHIFSDRTILMRKQGISKKGIEIGSNNWLGANVTVLDGVIITSDSVIGAGAVVSKSLIRKGIYLGVPAILRKDLE